MKCLVLTISCFRDRLNGSQDVICETWKKLCSIDHKFVLGLTPLVYYREDEVHLNVPDNYEGVPQKHHAAIKWALQEDYDYVFVSDIDTYIAFPRFYSTGFMDHDFVGCRCVDASHPSGGSGYWLSRRACEVLAASSPIGHSWSDLWAFTILHKAGISLHHDPRYSYGMPTKEQWDKGIVTANLGRSDKPWNPELMRRCHQFYMENIICGE